MSGSPSMHRGYDTRTYNLAANVAQALPSAREFMILSATVDITALNFSMGDDNGDQEIWPFGVIIGIKEGSVKARIGSSVNQTVVIAMLDGDVVVKDNRFAPGAGSLAVTEADGANAALGQKADASATTDGGTFSLISLFKRMLGKMGPVTSVDGGLVSLGTTTDATAPADTATASLISLFKRLLQKTSPLNIYSSRFAISSIAGSPLVNTSIVLGGSNVNGIAVFHYSLSCGPDITSIAQLIDSSIVLATVGDSQSVVCNAPFIVPPGQAFTASLQGASRVSVAYSIL